MKNRRTTRLSVLVKLTATVVTAILLLAGALDRYYAQQMETAAHEALDRRAFAIASGLANECEYGLLIGNRLLLEQAVVKVSKGFLPPDRAPRPGASAHDHQRALGRPAGSCNPRPERSSRSRRNQSSRSADRGLTGYCESASGACFSREPPRRRRSQEKPAACPRCS